MHLIQTIEEREIALRKTGLEYLVIHPFSEKFSRLSADDYERNPSRETQRSKSSCRI